VPVTSAGILLFRRPPVPQVFIAHMGGPFWAKRHEHAWSIPKGLLEPGESPLPAALREFTEEIGVPAPSVDYVDLGTVRASSGKVLHVFAGEAQGFEVVELRPGMFAMEWPPRSGRTAEFPEVDEARWADAAEARTLLVKGQLGALDALERHLATSA
jgi:predicted NUDIX family NTP pyrophosphohydrolase